MGPLEGVRVVELAGLGAAPFCAMVLADLGAEVVRVDRAAEVGAGPPLDAVLRRGRRSLAADLKQPAAAAAVLRLVERADALVEGFRPGVAERLGLGPDACLARNPRLVYGRVTGWGREGPLAGAAGHDLDYVALAGVLGAIGPRERPAVPLNLVGDFGGGGLLLATGILAALLAARSSGRGQVVDAAMVDGAALLATLVWGLRALGAWPAARGGNLLDGGAPFYDVYETADRRHLAVAALEPKFWRELLGRLGLDEAALPDRDDRTAWPALRERLAALFRTRTRQQWCDLLEGSDACVAPVLGLGEAPDHPHNRGRGTFVEVAGVTQPAPAPRFDATPTAVPTPPPGAGQHTTEILADWGFTPAETGQLLASGALVQG